MGDITLVHQAAQQIALRRENTPDGIPRREEWDGNSELLFPGDRYLVVLVPAEEATTVEVRNPRDCAIIATTIAREREPKQLAIEIEGFLPSDC